MCTCVYVHHSPCLIPRLQHVELVTVQEGAEPNDLCTLLGDRNSYHSLINGNDISACLYLDIIILS